jgi:hypothetical protein
MGGRLFEGPTMVGRTSDWKEELGRFLKPFLARLVHKARRQMCPLYVSGLIGPGDRKSIQPMAERLAFGEYDQLHHFIAAGVWNATPVETELLVQADRLVGGSDAVLVIDDTAIPKKGAHSVGVAAQYASALGKTANCQTLVSLTLARGEVPVMLALRLFLPESWTSKRARLERAGVPAGYRTARTKPEMALAEIDRAIAAGTEVCYPFGWHGSASEHFRSASRTALSRVAMSLSNIVDFLLLVMRPPGRAERSRTSGDFLRCAVIVRTNGTHPANRTNNHLIAHPAICDSRQLTMLCRGYV